MLDTIVNLIKEVWEILRPCQILYDYELGVVYQRGAYHSNMKTGWNWKFPWEIKEYKVITNQDDSKRLPSQRINGWSIVPIVRFHVKNARKYYKNVLSSKDSIVEDITASCIATAVIQNHNENPYDLIPLILTSIRHECRHYGYYVKQLEFPTCDRLKGYYHVISKEFPEATE